MKPFTRALAGSLGVSCALFAAGAGARPSQEVSTEFYAEAQHRNLVGERILSCAGGVVRWGRATRFSLRSSAPCNGVVAAGGRNVPAATLLLHHDPHFSCTLRCTQKFPRETCGPTEECDAGRNECLAACNALLAPPAEADGRAEPDVPTANR